MAALDFPASPTNGQEYTANGKTWRYQSSTTSWIAVSTEAEVASIAYNLYLYDNFR